MVSCNVDDTSKVTLESASLCELGYNKHNKVVCKPKTGTNGDCLCLLKRG